MKCQLEDLETVSALMEESELWRRGDATVERAIAS